MLCHFVHSMVRRCSFPLLIALAFSALALTSVPTFAATAPPKVVGYFTAWGIYDQPYTLKNIVSSGSAPLLTHLNYAFSDVAPVAAGSQVVCQLGDPWADYQKTWTAAESINGVAVSGGGALRGNFQQLRVLKARYPNLKVLISLGGWSWSQHFSDMAVTPASRTAFVKSCIDLFIKGNLPRDRDAGGPGAAAGLFDGIDIDWEFPGVCGDTCAFRSADRENFTALVQEFRRQLTAVGNQNSKAYLLTIAASSNPKMSAKLELSAIQQSLDFINVMAYDIHGSWEPTTNFNAPLYRSPNDPARNQNLTVSEAIQTFLNGGVPAAKLVMGTPFYGRGWAGVPRAKHGLYQTSTGPAAGRDELGLESFKVLKASLGAGGFVEYYDSVVQNAWLYNPAARELWSFDNGQTQAAKAAYVKSRKLGGMMFWELSADTPNGELIKALANALK
jgi:chitinase